MNARDPTVHPPPSRGPGHAAALGDVNHVTGGIVEDDLVGRHRAPIMKVALVDLNDRRDFAGRGHGLSRQLLGQ